MSLLKASLLSTLLASSLLSANMDDPLGPVKLGNSPQSNISKVEKNPEYIQAIKQFQQKKYTNALSRFGRLLDQYPANEKINYYYARSAFELKNYEFAFAAYDRILINNPMNHRARLEYARTLFMMESYDQALEEFEKVLTSPIPAQVRKNVESFLKILRDKKKGYKFSGAAIVSLGWNDNLGNATDEYTNNLITTFTNNTTKKKDFHLNAIVATNILKPLENKNLAWTTNAVIYTQKQDKYDNDDISLISLSTGIVHIDKNKKNTLSVLYDHIWLNRDNLMYYYGIGNNFQYRFNQQNALEFDLKYKKKKMAKKVDSTKQSHSIELGLKYLKTFEDKSLLSFSTSFNKERKEHGTRTDISQDIVKYGVAYKKPLKNDYTLDLSYQLEEKNYKIASISPITLTPFPKREDDKHTTTIKLTKKLSKTQSVSADYSYTKNRSNNNLFSYENNAANINYMILF